MSPEIASPELLAAIGARGQNLFPATAGRAFRAHGVNSDINKREKPRPTGTMLTFQPSTDYELIRIVLTHPRTYSFMANDSAPPLSKFQVQEGNYSAILCRQDDGMLAGLFLIVPTENPASAEIHFCFLPGSVWQMGEAGREFVQWVWSETALNTLIGKCPSYNPLALRTAKAAGFREAYTEYANETKDGQPFDLLVVKCERPQ